MSSFRWTGSLKALTHNASALDASVRHGDDEPTQWSLAEIKRSVINCYGLSHNNSRIADGQNEEETRQVSCQQR